MNQTTTWREVGRGCLRLGKAAGLAAAFTLRTINSHVASATALQLSRALARVETFNASAAGRTVVSAGDRTVAPRC